MNKKIYAVLLACIIAAGIGGSLWISNMAPPDVITATDGILMFIATLVICHLLSLFSLKITEPLCLADTTIYLASTSFSMSAMVINCGILGRVGIWVGLIYCLLNFHLVRDYVKNDLSWYKPIPETYG